jgi:hypothetical protein
VTVTAPPAAAVSSDARGDRQHGEGVELTHNDLFRVVHDVFGHVVFGYSFGPSGELKATYCQMALLPEVVRPVVFAKQVSQTCWFFFGPHLRDGAGCVPRRGERGYVPANRRAEGLFIRPTPARGVQQHVPAPSDAMTPVSMHHGVNAEALPASVRDDFPLLRPTPSELPIAYLDNAATTQSHSRCSAP